MDDLLGMKGFGMTVESTAKPDKPDNNLSAGILNDTFKMLGLNMDTLKREDKNESGATNDLKRVLD